MRASLPDLSTLGRRRAWWRRLVTTGGHADVVTYEIRSPRWTAPPLTLALVTDLHVMAPWTSLGAVARLVERVNALPVDTILLLGDYIADRRTPGLSAAIAPIAAALSRLRAPLGVHAILGNHDWKDDPGAQASNYETSQVIEALGAVGLMPMTNVARRLDHGPDGVWLVGFDSQRGHLPMGAEGARHDPDTAFGDVPDGAPTILLAHEPDYFHDGDSRPILQVSGHTHGGQLNLFGWRPFTPSQLKALYAYGHIRDGDRHLVVSGGIGYTLVPFRVAQPPEITLVRLQGP